MTHPEDRPLTSPLDAATRALVRLAAVTAGGTDAELRTAIQDAVRNCPSPWVEELILQTYLFAGFPRALNAARVWRRVAGADETPLAEYAAAPDYALENTTTWRARGQITCAHVYGDAYHKLRHNIAALHPALDAWMITEGYGKVLSRPALDLQRRELCIVAACAHTTQERQLHSHLHGARNVGVPDDVVDAALDVLSDVLRADAMASARHLWSRVRGQAA
ncbi:MAG TPA: carboxymuconolactone decarboxylase family protein [Gemmatimonadaceae bacterium]|nr:carboxymuconolactone decarboxylase family protein [Gemmatimonadaceae bacterium]